MRPGVGETVQAAYKTADTARQSTTTNTDDPHLTVPVKPNGVYRVTLDAYYTSSTTADFKMGWSGPSGATFVWTSDCPPSSASGVGVTPNRGVSTIASTITAGGIGTGLAATSVGTLTVGSTGGNLTFQWAQGTSEATDTTLLAGSALRVERIR